MKKLLLFGFVGLIGLTLTLAADDLGELAKKEKAKREALQKEGKTPKVMTNEDIEKMKATENADQSLGENQAEGTEEEGATADSILEGMSAEVPDSTNEVAGSEFVEEQQQEPSVDEQLRQLQEKKEAAEAQIKDAQEAVDKGGLFHTYAVGNQFREQREADNEIEELDKQIKKLETEKKNQEASKPQQDQNTTTEQQQSQDQQPQEEQQTTDEQPPSN
jgi:hypothetical protein